MSLRPQVALSNDFLRQLAKLPLSAHTKVLKWATIFQTDPTSPGINYEKIHKARDPNLKSVRLDQDWRGIVFKPSSGDLYILLYVDHHDAAYKWAETKKLSVNPVTGAMQLVTLEVVVERLPQIVPPGLDESAPAIHFESSTSAAHQQSKPAVSLFANYDDRELMSLGVPQELLSVVRTIHSEQELDALQESLPVEGYEGLFLLVAGDTVTQILSARETRVDMVVDTSDFLTAITTAESRSKFVVVNDDATMLAIMNAPLSQWRIFLHPAQSKLANGDRSGPVRVLGGAGTGKTVLAMHRAKWLAENRVREGQKLLFTTFTKNLAIDIEHNLRTLCAKEVMDRIEVKNLDALVGALMRAQKYEHRIVYDRKSDAAFQAWQAALAVKDPSLDLSDDFYQQELEQVVLAQGITSLDSYRIARRTGRGVVLSRSKRDAVWAVFEEYRGQLASRKLKEVDDAYREMRSILTAQVGAGSPYDAIVIDETQDFGPQALQLLRALLPSGTNDLFFVGDGHQRIYSRNRAAMSKCGIDIRGRSRKLYLNYRTTDEIRRQAVALLEGCEIDDLDDGHDETRRYKSLSHGPVPLMLSVQGLEDASAATVQFIADWRQSQQSETPLSFCVIASSERHRDGLAIILQKSGLRCVTITAQENHAEVSNVIHCATMHRAKGLEFDCVVVVTPKSYLSESDDSQTRRKLLYVALTRAKKGAALIQLGFD